MVEVTFWGVRGTIPTPGRSTLGIGGNTSCVEIVQGRNSLILDGGSGIRVLGEKRRPQEKRPIHILVSHTHLDHIVGIPFFAPALVNGNSVHIYGPPGIKKALQHLFPFPVLTSKRVLHEIRPREFRIPPFSISCQWLNHPGFALGYRVATPGGKNIVYMSDHEPPSIHRHHTGIPTDEKMRAWLQAADLLIMDAQYFDREYRDRKGWGHSPVSYTIETALKARVKKLVLFHHDPNHSDGRLREKLAQARSLIKRLGGGLPCFLAQEGWTVTLR